VDAFSAAGLYAFQKQGERGVCRGGANRITIALEMVLARDRRVIPYRHSEPDKTNRFVGTAAAGAGDASDGDGNPAVGRGGQGTAGHFRRCLR